MQHHDSRKKVNDRSLDGRRLSTANLSIGHGLEQRQLEGLLGVGEAAELDERAVDEVAEGYETD